MYEKIQAGEFDKYLTMPMMTKELLYSSIKARILKKIETKATPVLTDTQVLDAIEDAKEAAGSSMYIFLQLGLVEKTEDGYQLSKLGKLACKEVSRMK
jgi:predicted transcriptional regulator